MITSLFGYFAPSVEDKIQTVVGNNISSSDSGCLIFQCPKFNRANVGVCEPSCTFVSSNVSNSQ